MNHQFTKIKRFIANNIQPRTLMVMGPSKAGKTTLLRAFSGVHLNLNEQQKLVDKDDKPIQGNSLDEGIELEFEWTVLQVEKILIIQIFDIFNCVELEPSSQYAQNYFQALFLLTNLVHQSSQIAINIVINFEVLVDHSPLAKFLKAWQQIIAKDSDKINQIRQSITYTVAQAEYEQDGLQIYQLLQDICQQEQLSKDSSSMRTIEEMFIFLRKQIEEREGPQLLENILKKTKFIESSDLFESLNQFMIKEFDEKIDKEKKQRQKMIPDTFKQYEKEVEIDGQMICYILLNAYSSMSPNLQTTLDIDKYHKKLKQLGQVDSSIFSQLVDHRQQICHIVCQIMRKLADQSIVMENSHQYLKMLSNKVFMSQIWNQLEKKSEAIIKIRRLIEISVNQYKIFCQIDPDYMNTHFKSIISALLKSLKTSISNLQLFDKIQSSDPNFQKYDSYSFFKENFQQSKAESNSSDDDDIGDETQEIINRQYTNNKMKKEIESLLEKFEDPKNKKGNSITEFSKLFIQIQKQKDDKKRIQLIGGLANNLLQYRQYELCISISIKCFDQLPSLELLRSYISQMRNSTHQDAFKFIKETFIPYCYQKYNNAIKQDSSQLARRFLVRIMDFLSSERIFDAQQFQKTQQILKNFQCRKNIKYKNLNQSEPNDAKMVISKELKLDIKKRLDTKIKENNKIKDKIEMLLNHRL